jgi:hypothetical protein
MSNSPTTDSSGESTSSRKVIRKTPSAPDLAQSRQNPTIGPSKHPVARSDSRLDDAKTEVWGIKFISDDDFRKVLTSYIIWDHPCWGVFDVNEFCEALSGKPSELSSRLLVFAVLAYALVSRKHNKNSGSTDMSHQRLYVYFDVKVASAHGVAWEETKRLWQEAIDEKDDSLVTAAAGTLLYASYGAHGGMTYEWRGPCLLEVKLTYLAV